MGILSEVQKVKQNPPSLDSEEPRTPGGILGRTEEVRAAQPQWWDRASQFAAESLNSATLGASGMMERGLRSGLNMFLSPEDEFQSVEEARGALDPMALNLARGTGNVLGATVPIAATAGLLGRTAKGGTDAALRAVTPQINSWLGRNVAAPAVGGATAAATTAAGSSSGIDEVLENPVRTLGTAALGGVAGNAAGRAALEGMDFVTSNIPLVGRSRTHPVTVARAKKSYLTSGDDGQTELGRVMQSEEPVTPESLLRKVQQAPNSNVVGDVVTSPGGTRTGSAITAQQVARPSSKELTADLEDTLTNPRYNRNMAADRAAKKAADAMYPQRSSAPTYSKTEFDQKVAQRRKPINQRFSQFFEKNENVKFDPNPVLKSIDDNFTASDNLDGIAKQLKRRVEKVLDEDGMISAVDLHKVKQDVGGYINNAMTKGKRPINRTRTNNASSNLYKTINSRLAKMKNGNEYMQINKEYGKLAEEAEFTTDGFTKARKDSPENFAAWYDSHTPNQKTAIKNGALMSYNDLINKEQKPDKFLQGTTKASGVLLKNLKHMGIKTGEAQSLARKAQTERDVTSNYANALNRREKQGVFENTTATGQINPVAAALSTGLSIGRSRVPTVGERSQMLRAGRDVLGLTSAEDDFLVDLLTSKAGRGNKGESKLFDLMNVDDILTRRANRAGASGAVRGGAATEMITNAPTSDDAKKARERRRKRNRSDRSM